MWGPVYVQLRVLQLLSSIENSILVSLIIFEHPTYSIFFSLCVIEQFTSGCLFVISGTFAELWVVYERLRIQSSFRYGREDKESCSMKTFLYSGCASWGETEILLLICEMGRLTMPGLYAMSFPHRRFRIGECFLPQDYTSVSIPPKRQNTWRNQLRRRMDFVYGLSTLLLWVCGSSVPHGKSIKQKTHRPIFTSQHPGISKKGSEGWHPNIPFKDTSPSMATD